MTCPSVVRLGVEADRLGIWRLILHGHRESGFFPLAPDRVDWWLSRMLNPHLIAEWDTGPRGAVGVIGPIGDVEAMVLIAFGNYWYTQERHLEEFLVCVDPEHRASEHAKSLISWMKEQSVLTGLPLVTGVMSNHRTEAKVRLYSRMLPKAGAFFVFNGKGSVIGSSMAAAAT